MLINKFFSSILVLIIFGCSDNMPLPSPSASPIPSSANSNNARYINLPTDLPSDVPEDRDLFSLHQRFVDTKELSELRTNRDNIDSPMKYLGDVDSFWVSDLVDNKVNQV